jgi:tRNA 2-thiouridine synthesizing protein A
MARDKPGHDELKGLRKNVRKSPTMTDTSINLRGLKCPLPALRTRKALSKLQAGDLLTIECTDPLVDIDIPNLIRETGDSIEATSRESDAIIFRIRKL